MRFLFFPRTRLAQAQTRPVRTIEDGYTVQVRLSNETKPEDSALGEEIVDSFETASELVAALAGEFSIAQACIKIENPNAQP